MLIGADINPYFYPLTNLNMGRVQVRTGGTVHRANVSADGPGLMAASTKAASFNVAHASNGADCILGTATRGGTPKPVSELHPTDKVTINGMETTVQVAERLDLITRDSHSGMLTNGTEEAIRQVTREPAPVTPDSRGLASRAGLRAGAGRATVNARLSARPSQETSTIAW